jgi:hypothetical protein
MIEENTAEKLFDYLGGYSSSSILSALCLIILLVEGFNRSTDKQLNELTEHQPLKTGIDFWCRAEHISEKMFSSEICGTVRKQKKSPLN